MEKEDIFNVDEESPEAIPYTHILVHMNMIPSDRDRKTLRQKWGDIVLFVRIAKSAIFRACSCQNGKNGAVMERGVLTPRIKGKKRERKGGRNKKMGS